MRHICAGVLIDGYNEATPLDVLSQNTSVLMEVLYQTDPTLSTGLGAGAGWEWVNVGFLLGGLFLLYQRVVTGHAPVSMPVTLTIMAALFYDGGSSHSGGSPLLHLSAGAAVLGASCVLTDPTYS